MTPFWTGLVIGALAGAVAALVAIKIVCDAILRDEKQRMDEEAHRGRT